MSAKEQYDDFIQRSKKAIYELYDAVSIMPYKGDKFCDSQKIGLIQALIELDKCITGTLIEDFIQEESNA